MIHISIFAETSFCAFFFFFFFSSKHIVAIMEQLVFSTDIQNSIIFISWWWWSPALCLWAKPSGLFWFCFWGVGGDNIVQVLRVKHIWNHFSPFLNSSLVLWGHVLNQFAPVLNTTEDALLYLKFCWAGKPGAEAVIGFAMLQFSLFTVLCQKLNLSHCISEPFLCHSANLRHFCPLFQVWAPWSHLTNLNSQIKRGGGCWVRTFYPN